nr:hypothetical protein GCM10020092_040780 [Actinoplanes digitatis]
MTAPGAEFDEIYRATAASGGPPWDIGGPQPALAAALDGHVKGPRVLDVGCGTGDLALTLARRGYDVTAVDVSPVAIGVARAKAAAAGLPVHFEVQDATRLSLPPPRSTRSSTPACCTSSTAAPTARRTTTSRCCRASRRRARRSSCSRCPLRRVTAGA